MKGHTQSRRLVVIAMLAVLGLQGPISAQEPKPGASTGQKIGNAISTAIGIAFPPVQQIIQAIWGGDAGKGKKAKDAEPKLNEMQKPAIARLKQVSADLDAANAYLVDCMEADQQVVAMQVLLADKKDTFTDTEQQQLQQRWNLAAPRIKELAQDSFKSKANGVSDAYIQRTLIAISRMNLGGLDNIQDSIKTKNPTLLRTQLADLEPKLSGVTALAGDIVNQVSVALFDAAKALSGPQGAQPDEEKAFRARSEERAKKFDTVLKNVYPEPRQQQ